MAGVSIDIPYNFTLRDYQLPFWTAIQDDPVRRAVLVWPRRHGKDKTMLNALVPQMLRRVGAYYYVFPEFNQGRKALWDNLDNDGFRTINHIPEALRTSTDQQQMKIQLYNGSIFQVIGASDIDRIVGTNPVGIVFSEYSLMSPSVIGFLLPIVQANDGFLWFNFTPRGDNHAHTLYQEAKKRGWFVSFMTARSAGVFSDGELNEIKKEYVSIYGDERLFNQEMMCSFDEPIQGSYYGDLISRAEEDGRLGNVVHRAEIPVTTYWDLGVGDAMSIWFVQHVGDEIHLIDYYESNGKGLDFYIKMIKEKPYVYDDHYAPHDIRVREMGSGLSRIEVARSLGLNFKIAPKLSIEDGINAARTILPRCYFDAKKCESGIAALKNYHRKYNEELRVYDNKPLHDWSSNGADAFRYLAVSLKKNGNQRSVPQDDIPFYAQAGGGFTAAYTPRGNPFAPQPNYDMGLSTDAFDDRGFVR
jgi:phage terminase large subunit